MCTLFIAIDMHPDYPLVVAGNRDEFYPRKTASLQDWGRIVGGRDLQQGGYWFATDKRGRWAALTNYRGGLSQLNKPHTRGDLVKDYLQGELSIEAYIQHIQSGSRCYEGFNLLLGDAQGRVAHYSNISEQLSSLSKGVYALSNALLDTPWPKVVRGKKVFSDILRGPSEALPAAIFAMLKNPQQAAKAELPSTGVPALMEQLLSALFIAGPAYGTRSSALLLKSNTGTLRFIEQGYGVFGRQRKLTELCI